MSNFSLDVLRQHREQLLMAEVAALLHDMGKCTSEFAYIKAARSIDKFDPYKAIFTPKELSNYAFSPQRVQERCREAKQRYALHNLLSDHVKTRLDAKFTIDGQEYTIREAIYFSRPRFIGHISNPLRRSGAPLDLLAACHRESHAEKEEPLPSVTPQTIARHSAFGFQLLELPKVNQPGNLTEQLNSLDWERVIRFRNRYKLEELFNKALGDTRFPINEVSLWDWSYAVASLYKSELARHIFTGEWRQHNQLAWRLLRINFDVLGLYAKAIKIADLLAYRDAVHRACETVKQLVEDEYPLGNEVYRDTSGIYFTFPDIDLFPELAEEIQRRVEQIEPELAPRIGVVRGDGKTADEQLKGILAKARTIALGKLVHPFDSQSRIRYWQQQWQNGPDGKFEVCPVCRLRPKTEKKDVCGHCEERRKSRIEFWEENLARTIWLDEIADHNGRLALLVGKFDLDRWLSGDLVQTMLVREKDNNPTACTPKNPSPARLRRVWETCKRFWTDTVVGTILEPFPYAEKRPDAALRCTRMYVTPDKKEGWKGHVPYDGTIGSQPISLLWKEQEQRFITIVNLHLAASGAQTPDALQKKWLKQDVDVSDPDDPQKRIRFKIEAITPAQDQWGCYSPCLSLLASPDQFLALIPAADSLEIAHQVEKEYRKQFGKVQNRLPLFIGLVYFPRKTPLMAAMDTARRMLEQTSMDEETWTVECSRAIDNSNNSTWSLRLSRGDQRVKLNVPIRMGDGTQDVWYPYFFVEPGTDIRARRLHFEHNGRQLVHVKCLREDDQVRITPSRFAYLFLEQTAQRFRFDPERDVMLLDELPNLLTMWTRLKTCGITDTGLRAVAHLLETKAELWGCDSPEFRCLTETTLKESGLWQKKGQSNAVTPNEVLSGRFSRCLELYLHILKTRLKQEHDNERQPKTV